MNANKWLVVVKQREEITRFTRVTIRGLQDELDLLWAEFPNAKEISLTPKHKAA